MALQEPGDPRRGRPTPRLPGLGPQDQPVDAQRGVALHLGRVDRPERHRRDLECAQPRRPVHLVRGPPQPVEVAGDLLRGPVAVEAVGAAHRPPVRAGAATADDHPETGRPGVRVDLGEVDVATVELGRRLRPQRGHRVEVLVGAPAAPGRGDADGRHLGRQPSGADAEHEPAAAEHVQARGLLRQHQRVALRKDDHGGAERHPAGDRGDVGQVHERVDDRGGRVDRRAGRRRQHDVVLRPPRPVAQLLGQPGQRERGVEPGQRVEALDPEFHSDRSDLDDGLARHLAGRAAPRRPRRPGPTTRASRSAGRAGPPRPAPAAPRCRRRTPAYPVSTVKTSTARCPPRRRSASKSIVVGCPDACPTDSATPPSASSATAAASSGPPTLSTTPCTGATPARSVTTSAAPSSRSPAPRAGGPHLGHDVRTGEGGELHRVPADAAGRPGHQHAPAQQRAEPPHRPQRGRRPRRAGPPRRRGRPRRARRRGRRSRPPAAWPARRPWRRRRPGCPRAARSRRPRPRRRRPRRPHPGTPPTPCIASA